MSPIRIKKTIIAIPIAGLLALGLSACGDAGSSGTTAPEDVTGKGCEPIAGDELVQLEDDKKLQASENIIAAFNTKTASPEAVEATDAVAAKLTTDKLAELNKAVDIDRKSAKEAAADFADAEKLTDGLPKGGSGDLVIGHANFSESEIMANLYKIALDGAGFDTELKDVGNREAYLPALGSGDFDVIPEYAASLTETLNPDAESGGDPVASNNIDETIETVTPWAGDAGLTLGQPAEAANQNAYVVTKKFAEEHGVTTLSDFGKECSGKASVLAGPPECPKRIYCQVGLESTYDIQVGTFKSLDIGTSTKRSVSSGESTLGTITTTDSALVDGVKVE
jgi:osmoprotectant transport system substrate-binding protein